ncbi:MAG TPA: ATP-binding protein [Candidatus Saccharimonadales bacterium]|nr:ATP-binding protein [Candidatus Saccharimonadales bacterium]
MECQSRKLHSRGGLEHLPKCISLVAEAARHAGLSRGQRDALEAATREAYLAIVEATQGDSHRGPIEAEVGWDNRAVTVRLTHGGRALDSLFDRALPDPRVEAMRRALDEVGYTRGTRHGHQLWLRMRAAEARRNPRLRAAAVRQAAGR